MECTLVGAARRIAHLGAAFQSERGDSSNETGPRLSPRILDSRGPTLSKFLAHIVYSRRKLYQTDILFKNIICVSQSNNML